MDEVGVDVIGVFGEFVVMGVDGFEFEIVVVYFFYVLLDCDVVYVE